MTLTEMRAIVRRDLHDEDAANYRWSDDELDELVDAIKGGKPDLHDEDAANYRWSDDELDRHIAHAAKEFSEAIPYEQKATIAIMFASLGEVQV